MELVYKIMYHTDVVQKDIPALSQVNKKRIQTAIQNKLMRDPITFGSPLRRSYAGYRKLRVGDYRIIFLLQKNIVKIFVIGHRSVVYEKYVNRF